ncbi:MULTISPECIES: hypothetical protein [unclassified Cupriavidus]|uniref:hypothetical protein n=1 Tax=Cupriavidus sp. H19C3 TaxID=3241603 RepID=UPI003BF91F13
MTTLTINDLSVTETLDAKGMRAVRGGFGFVPFTSIYSPVKLSFDSVRKIDQSNQQMQEVNSMFANGSAFQDHLKNDVYTNQNATNRA